MIKLIINFYGIFLIIIVFSYFQVYAQIKAREKNDGTIEYYNVNVEESNKKYNQKTIDLSKNPYDTIIVNICKNENIDPQLIRCIIKIESNFNKDAVSVAGAMGLMQLMQETVNAYNIQDPFDPEQNIYAGVKHLKSLLSILKNDLILALAAYHAGLGIVKKNMAVPNIKSTIKYVNAVMELYKPGKNHDYTSKVEKLFMHILPDGTINITNK